MGRYKSAIQKVARKHPDALNDWRMMRGILLDERCDSLVVEVLCCFAKERVPEKLSNLAGNKGAARQIDRIVDNLHNTYGTDKKLLEEAMSDVCSVYDIKYSPKHKKASATAAASTASSTAPLQIVKNIQNKVSGKHLVLWVIIGILLVCLVVVTLILLVSKADSDSVQQTTASGETVTIKVEEKPVLKSEVVEERMPIKKCKTESVLINGVSFKLVEVEGGTFKMGSSSNEANADERPVHKVTLNSFYIMETEVTQNLWEKVMHSNPSEFKGADLPVDNVKKEEAESFIFNLNWATGKKFRLPTEAEWEYAAQGGKYSRGFKYAGSNNIGKVAWYGENSLGQTHPVASKAPNEIGLYDMTGNVWEWCSDWYGEYPDASVSNPVGPNFGTFYVLRGGAWDKGTEYQRIRLRQGLLRHSKCNSVGLRLVMTK